jgi:hypothetical protein
MSASRDCPSTADATSVVVVAMVAGMPESTTPAAPSAADAEVAVARLAAMSADLRGCVIVDPDGKPLAASGDTAAWGEAARELLAAADSAAGEPALQTHVGIEDGEAFAVRHEGFALVAAAERFALASLMLFDMRAVLRDLVRGPDAPSIREPSVNGAHG